MKLTTPSGLEVEMRGTKVKEEDILTNPQIAKEGKTFDLILDNCVKSDFPVKKMLQGDRTFLLIKLRSISYGNLFQSELNCGKCGSLFTEEIDLDSLETKELDKDKLQLDNGRYIFETDPLPALKKKVIMKLLTGDDEDKIRQIRKNYPEEVMTRLLLLRIVSIEGERVKNPNMIRDLEGRDAVYLRQVYEDHDCGVNTRIEVNCPNCYSTQYVDLPIDNTDFFLPFKSQKNQKTTTKKK